MEKPDVTVTRPADAHKSPTTAKKSWGRPFPKGQSGNPGGRPSIKPITEMLREYAAKPTTKARIFKALDKAIDKANVATIMAIREMMDRIEGRVPTPVSLKDEDTGLTLRISEMLQKGRERNAQLKLDRAQRGMVIDAPALPSNEPNSVLIEPNSSITQ